MERPQIQLVALFSTLTVTAPERALRQVDGEAGAVGIVGLMEGTRPTQLRLAAKPLKVLHLSQHVLDGELTAKVGVVDCTSPSGEGCRFVHSLDGMNQRNGPELSSRSTPIRCPSGHSNRCSSHQFVSQTFCTIQKHRPRRSWDNRKCHSGLILTNI